MKKTRTHKASLNISTSALYELTTFICGLILPRLILSNFGSAYNGITTSVTQFLSLVSILRLGIAGATRVSLYQSLATDDINKTSSIVKATEQYMRKIGIVIIAYVGFMAVCYPLLVDTGFGFWDVSLLVIAAGIGTFAQYFFGITYSTLLTADQSVYVYNIIQTVCTIVNTGISALLIYFGCSIQIVKLSSSVIFFITPVFLSFYVSKRYNLNKHCKPDISSLNQKKDVLAHSIANIVHENTDVIVLTVFCDVKIVSVYTVYNLVMSALRKVLNIFTTGTEPIFGDMWAKNEHDGIRRNLQIYEYAISVFVSVVFSTTLVLLIPFISIYTSGVSDTEYILPAYAFVITIAQVFYCIRTPYLTLVQGVGRYKETRNGAIAEALINLTSSVVLVNIIGITGTAVGTLLANVFRTYQYAFYIDNHLIKRSKLIIFFRVFWMTGNIMVSYFVSNILLRYITINGWFQWILVGIISLLFSSVVTVITSLIFYREDFKRLFGIIKRMLNKA